jgi:hypothetical protein
MSPFALSLSKGRTCDVRPATKEQGQPFDKLRANGFGYASGLNKTAITRYTGIND